MIYAICIYNQGPRSEMPYPAPGWVPHHCLQQHAWQNVCRDLFAYVFESDRQLKCAKAAHTDPGLPDVPPPGRPSDDS